MITLWQIDSMNRANRKLREVIDTAPVRDAIRKKCSEHQVPFDEADARGSFTRLFREVAARTPNPGRPGIPQGPQIARGEGESHQQAACEDLAASILDSLGIAWRESS